MGKVEKSSEYNQFDPGVYDIDHVEFFTTDDQDRPIFVTQEWGGKIRMVARYRTMRGEDEGPPGSIQPHEIPLFVKAFGGDYTQLPDDNLQALSKAEELIRFADKKVKVRVGKSGWVQNVIGMTLPCGTYTFKFAGVRNRDKDTGDPTWFNSNYGTNTVLNFEVVNDGPFKGCIAEVWLNRTSLDIYRALLGEVYENIFGSVDEELGIVEEMALSAEHLISGDVVAPEGKKPRVDKASLRHVTTDQVEETSDNVPPVHHLWQAIADGVDKKPWRESAAFKNVGQLSDVGGAWARENLAPVAKEHGLPKSFDEMTDEHVSTYLKGLGREDLVEGTNSEW